MTGEIVEGVQLDYIYGDYSIESISARKSDIIQPRHEDGEYEFDDSDYEEGEYAY